MARAAQMVEVFSSVQGEGPHVGTSTLFMRFGGCDLRCRWCDSPHTWQPAPTCRLEIERGTGRSRGVANPVALEALVAAARALEAKAHRFVALTGGEPLLQPAAVAELAARLRPEGPRILLETHGLASSALEQVVEQVDVVSMDWKLASDVRRARDPEGAPLVPFHEEHERFLRVARRAPEVVVKIVVTASTRDEEVLEAATRIARVAPQTPLVLQPVTPFGPVRERPRAERLLTLQARAAERLPDVRLIPQTHPLYGAP